jgi:hypothetical protein
LYLLAISSVLSVSSVVNSGEFGLSKLDKD